MDWLRTFHPFEAHSGTYSDVSDTNCENATATGKASPFHIHSCYFFFSLVCLPTSFEITFGRLEMWCERFWNFVQHSGPLSVVDVCIGAWCEARPVPYANLCTHAYRQTREESLLGFRLSMLIIHKIDRKWKPFHFWVKHQEWHRRYEPDIKTVPNTTQ